MTRTARLAAVPELKPGDRIEILDDGRRITIQDLGDRMRASRSKLERDVAAGLPCIDIGRHHPDRRRKRSLRFSWPEVVQWYRNRNVQNGGG